MISTRKMSGSRLFKNNTKASKTQALSVTGTLAMFTAIFLHDSLELFLTGRD
jgi:hypothetical protein